MTSDPAVIHPYKLSIRLGAQTPMENSAQYVTKMKFIYEE